MSHMNWDHDRFIELLHRAEDDLIDGGLLDLPIAPLYASQKAVGADLSSVPAQKLSGPQAGAQGRAVPYSPSAEFVAQIEAGLRAFEEREAAADEDIRLGRVVSYDNDDDFLASFEEDR